MWTVHRISLSLIAATLIVGMAEEIYRRALIPPLFMRIAAIVLLVSMAVYFLTRKTKPKADRPDRRPKSNAP